MSKNIGLHIRLEDSLTNVAKKALELEIKFFQTFVTLANGKYIRLEEDDVKQFLKLRDKFENTYLHGSYWINLCSAKGRGLGILKRELKIANRLRFSHLILHPGAATGFKTKNEGIQKLADNLNEVLKNEFETQIVLENTTHGRLSIGGDLKDYQKLLTLLEKPEQIKFCIDSAHAYGYGYEISKPETLKKFIEEIDKTIEIQNVVLLHLNDTREKLGSKIDKHMVPGEGVLGKENLQNFIRSFNPDLPILIELSASDDHRNAEILEEIRTW